MLILRGKGDARAGHPAVDAEDRRFEDQVVDADEDAIPVADRDPQFRDAAGVGGAFLERDQVRDVGQLGELGRRDVDRVADRVVVKHPGQVAWRRRPCGSG